MKKNKVTMKDVAREAGVSVATVSYIINNRTDQKISEETRKKVLQIINLLEYYPNQSARALANKKIRNIALITPETDNIFYKSELFDFIKDLATFFEKNNFQLSIIGRDIPDPLNEYDALIAMDQSKENFYNIGDKTFSPLIALSSYIYEPFFYQINYNYSNIYNEAKDYFKDTFTLYAIDTDNTDRKNKIKEVFENVVFVNNPNQLKENLPKNILLVEKILYEYIDKSESNVYYYRLNLEKKLETLHEVIKLLEQKIPSDKHYIYL